MELNDLLIGSRPLKVGYAGQTFTFAYDPGAYDQGVQAKANKVQTLADDDPRKLDYVNFVLLAVLEEWDLTSGGVPVPIDAEIIGKLHFVLKAIMVGAIMADMTSGDDADPKGPPSSSRSTSSPTANGAAALTGTRSSEPLTAAIASPGS